jgi:hypothetical protein
LNGFTVGINYDVSHTSLAIDGNAPLICIEIAQI